MGSMIVTGGCGFIGSHLVELLVEKGHKVYIVDDLSAGYIKNVDVSSDRVSVVQQKVEEFDFYSLGKVDAVFHLAAQASVPYSVMNFVKSSTTNLVSTFKVIEYCTFHKIPLVYATSSAVYGNLPFGLETGEIELLSPYATDKYCMEMYTKANYNLNGARSFGLRFFNVYGPRQDSSNPYSGVISIFADRLIKKQPITINGGYQTRDFVFVKDVVACLYKAYEYLLTNSKAEVSNILTGKSISIDELVGFLGEILDTHPECIYKPLPPGDPESSLGSIEIMEHLLNVKASNFVGVQEGLIATVEYIKEEILRNK